MRFFLVLLVLLSTAFALQCYIKVSTNKDYIPSSADGMPCVIGNATQCYSVRVDGSKNGVISMSSFGCDINGVICAGIPNGKCTNDQGVETCCCGTDLCNQNSAQGAYFFLGSLLSVAYMLH